MIGFDLARGVLLGLRGRLVLFTVLGDHSRGIQLQTY